MTRDDAASTPLHDQALEGLERAADPDAVVEAVRARYAAAAIAAARGAPSGDVASAESYCGCGEDGCGGPSGQDVAAGRNLSSVDDLGSFGQILYSPEDRSTLPEAAVLASLGCGNPLAVAELREGERVLDLGSGGGIDVLLSAGRVGPSGKAYGLDMTEEMLALARRNATDAGATNVEFLRGRIESIPLPSDSIDVVISNCVINLSADKSAVFAEMARVLRPGGRIGITDIVARDDLTLDDRRSRGTYAGCIAGALSFAEYAAGLHAVGFENVRIDPTREVADGMFSSIVAARKPMAGVPEVGGDDHAGLAADPDAGADASPQTGPTSKLLPIAGAQGSCCG